MDKLPNDVARCRNLARNCPAGHHCRRHLDKPGNGGHYAAWDSRREPGADRCDGFIPINDQPFSTTAQGGNP